MSDNNSLLPDVIEPLSNAVHQNLPETEKETDGVLSTVVGFFNNVVLYPVKKANLTFKYKLENFEADLQNKIVDIPPENLQEPPIMIAGPTLEALRYAYDEEQLREMYENLLASAMDNRKNNETLPSFVDAIKQMSPLDALILNRLVDLYQVMAAKISFGIKNTTSIYSKAMPSLFVPELLEDNDPFEVSTSLLNLSRLGFLIIMDGTIKGRDYNLILQHQYIQDRLFLFKEFGEEIEVKKTDKVILLNDYGKTFAHICLGKE